MSATQPRKSAGWRSDCAPERASVHKTLRRRVIAVRLGLRSREEPVDLETLISWQAPPDVQADLLALTTEFARQFVIYGRRDPIGMLHAVTSSVAARSVLPLLPAQVARGTYDRLWQTGGALVSVYSCGAAAEAVPDSEPRSQDDLADWAAHTRDAHAIKLTEACLRLHAERPEPALLHAAARASDLLG